MNVIESKEALLSLEEYAEVLKLQIKQLEGTGEFFVSKTKLDFDSAGKPWKGHAVLVGPKGLVSARKLQKEGVLFHEATCTKQGKELAPSGLEPRFAKEAARTLKKLHVGFKIAGVEEEGEDGAESAATAATADTASAASAAPPGDLGKRAARIAKAVEVWNKTEKVATQELRKLQKALLALDDPRSKPIIQGLEGILAEIDTVDDEGRDVEAAAASGDAAGFETARAAFVRKLEGIRAHVEQDELIRMADTNPLLEIKLRDTFTKSLSQLIQAV